MNQSTLNPFRPTRWEHQHDGNQLIWFTPVASHLAGEKSMYVSGSRGSGKTTLLKSICWEDLARNPSLRMQRKIEDSESIGVYIRFPDHLTAAMAFIDWQRLYPQSANPDLEFHRFFSLLVELTCCERMLHACHELRGHGLLTATPASERALAFQVLDEFPRLAHLSEFPVATFHQLSRLLRDVVRRMNEAAGRGTVRALNEGLPPREPGELLSFVATALSKIVRLPKHPRRAPGFKFCLDDCEVLSTAQQLSINTLVRTAKHPVSWVISYVGSLFENSRTYLEHQPLTDADRRVISLDSRDEKDFRELCQAVVSLRLMFSISERARTTRRIKNVSEFFPLRDRLGERSVNEIMEQMIKKSISPVATKLRHAAAQIQHVVYPEQSAGRANQILPYYQAYVLLHWQGKQDSFKTSFDVTDEEAIVQRANANRHPAGSAWLRRKQNAALLHLASTLGSKRLPLAGANIIVSLADGSIRDFLEILGFVFEAYARKRKVDPSSQSSLDSFALARTTIAAEIQTAGIYKASETYLAGVSARGERDFDVVLRFIEALGYYTAALQANPRDPTVLGTSERGIFQVRFQALRNHPTGLFADREKVVWSIIRQAEIAGYIRMLALPSSDSEPSGRDGQVLRFHLHRRLAPYFGFSYRGPYEMVGLSASDIWQLCDRASPVDPEFWAEIVSARPNALNQGELNLSWSDGA